MWIYGWVLIYADGCMALWSVISACVRGVVDIMAGDAPGCPQKLCGVLIVLMGQSAAGKGHTAQRIRKQLTDCGVPPAVIHHLQRDEFIHEAGECTRECG